MSNLGVEMILKEIHQFYILYPKLSSRVGDGGHEICIFFGLFTLQMLHTKFGKDWHSSSWEEGFNGRHTIRDANN